MHEYTLLVEHQMRRFYRSLNERDRRRYAAVEAMKLGHGSIEYVANVLSCDAKTIAKGIQELASEEELANDRQRKKRGGRKALSATTPKLIENFHKVLHDHTAGDPMRTGIKWTNLSRRQIARQLKGPESLCYPLRGPHATVIIITSDTQNY